jgi:hypothetical protein
MKTWAPGESPSYVIGLAHATKAARSSRHLNVAPGSLLVNPNVAVGLTAGLAGFSVIVVPGPPVSTVNVVGAL